MWLRILSFDRLATMPTLLLLLESRAVSMPMVAPVMVAFGHSRMVMSWMVDRP